MFALPPNRARFFRALASPRYRRDSRCANTTLPIVFWAGGDPVRMGLVASLNRPGGDLTGVNSMNRRQADRVRALHFAALFSNTRCLGILIVRGTASSLGLQIQIVIADSSDGIDAAFAMLAQMRPDALLIATTTLFLEKRVRLATLAAYHRLPTIFGVREFVEAGGLMSYGERVEELYRQIGIYSGRILKGDKPSDLPVWRSTRFTASLLAIADEVID